MILSGYQNNRRELAGTVEQTNDGCSIKGDLNYTEHDNQEREYFYHISYVHEGFISTVSLFDGLMKILIGFSIFNSVIIFKDLGSGCYFKNSISK